jgi:hypothetical protein
MKIPIMSLISGLDIVLTYVSKLLFEPDDSTEDMTDWKVVKSIYDYDFVKRRTGVYMVNGVLHSK